MTARAQVNHSNKKKTKHLKSPHLLLQSNLITGCASAGCERRYNKYGINKCGEREKLHLAGKSPVFMSEHMCAPMWAEV